MNKKLKLFIITLGVLLVVCILVYRFSNVAPDKNLTPDEQMMEIFSSGGCIMCHIRMDSSYTVLHDSNSAPVLSDTITSIVGYFPFYYNLPIVKDIMDKDINDGLRHSDLSRFYYFGLTGNCKKDIDEVNLAKIEKVVMDETMPPFKYYVFYWGASLNNEEKNIVLNWVKERRAKYYATNLASKEFANEPIQPLPTYENINYHKAVLGNILYNDTRLSKDNTISCASCHNLSTGGVDNKQYSEGYKKQLGGINAPTVFNAVYNFVQFWDGRAADLVEQAGGPPLNPVEMASKDWDEIIAKYSNDLTLLQSFNLIYPDGITGLNICDAIAEYEKTLTTPNSKFDKYLKGNKAILSKDEKEGYELFKKHECATCHVGKNIGGQSFEFTGLKNNYFTDRKNNKKIEVNENDYGRYNFTKNELDRYKFKVPTLRNIALTYPYWHDGTMKKLDEPVIAMLKYQCDKTLPERDIKKIISFLNTLTGEFDGHLLSNSNK